LLSVLSTITLDYLTEEETRIVQKKNAWVFLEEKSVCVLGMHAGGNTKVSDVRSERILGKKRSVGACEK